MIDNLVKKRIDFNFGGIKTKFDLSQSLFSSVDIDAGTKILLNSLRKNSDIKFDSVLDLGCGYGVIGIYIKMQNPASNVYCVDRDFIAVEFSKRNAKLNSCNIECSGSLDYSALADKRFDLIVCNFPAKAGENALRKFVYDASLHLNKGGVFAVVIVKELEEQFNDLLNDDIEIVHKENKAGYVIFHLKYKSEIKFEGEAYTRNKFDYRIDDKKYKFKSAYGIPEFESPSFASLAVKEILRKCVSVNKVGVFNPGQGFLGLFAEHYLSPKEIVLCSRDFLALEYSKDNLERNGFDNINVEFNYFPEDMSENMSGDLLIFNVDEDEDLSVLRNQLMSFSEKYSSLIICCKSRLLTELLKKMKLKVSAEHSIGKFSAVLLKK